MKGVMEGYPECWRDVPGYGGKYQASTHGQVRRVDGRGKYLVLKPFTRKSGKNRRVQKVWMIEPNGHRTERAVLSIVANTWCPPPPGYVVIHQSNMFTDNSVMNIRYVKREKLPVIYARPINRRAVCKLDEAGNVIEIYASAKQAARANYINLSTLCKHCNGEIKNPRITDGIRFRWDTRPNEETGW